MDRCIAFNEDHEIEGSTPIPEGLARVVMKKHIPFYMDLANRTAGLSVAKRRRVGAVIITEQRSLFLGYNGMPSGMNNACELTDGSTNPLVIHAEANALDKMAREGVHVEGSVCFTTTYPCPDCAKRLCAAGVKYVIYQERYHTHLAQEIFDHYGVGVFEYKQLDLRG